MLIAILGPRGAGKTDLSRRIIRQGQYREMLGLMTTIAVTDDINSRPAGDCIYHGDTSRHGLIAKAWDRESIEAKADRIIIVKASAPVIREHLRYRLSITTDPTRRALIKSCIEESGETEVEDHYAALHADFPDAMIYIPGHFE